MNKILYILILFVFGFCQIAYAEPVENDFGIVNGWYNGQEATVENIKIKIGEPIEIKVNVISKIDCNVYVELTNPLVTSPYEIISGPSGFDDIIQNRGIKSGWSNDFQWVIAPNGNWVNGNAPINIFVEFSDQGDDRKVEFTIANPYILDEQYSAPAGTDAAPSSDDRAGSEGLPGFGAAGALIAVAAAVLVKRKL